MITHEDLALTIRNDLEELGRVWDVASELLARHAVEPKVAYSTHLALEEVLSNVIRHAWHDHGPHEIEVRFRVGTGRVELEVVDDGQEFNPLSAPDPNFEVPLAQRKVGGLGIHLLRKFVREMRYERIGGRNSFWLRI